jgi:4-amino-4-deoxy-L-arabinose transferase-like glycosyltransferase
LEFDRSAGILEDTFATASDGTRRVHHGLLTHRSALGLGVILSIAALFRLATIFLAPAFQLNNDTSQYFTAGYSLATDGQLDLHVKRAPLYPVFLAGVIRVLGPSLETTAVVQHVLGLVTVVLVYLLGAVAFGRPTGLVAALGAATCGALLLTEHTVASEAVFTPLLVGSLLLVVLGIRTERSSFFLAAGLALGCCALTRAIAPAMLPLALGAVIVRPGTWRSRGLAAGLLGLGFLMVTGPWVLRSQQIHGIPTTSGGLGNALLARVHRHDPTFDFHDYGPPELDPARASIRERVFALAQKTRFESDIERVLQDNYKLSPSQSEVFMRDAALQVIRQEPERYVQGTVAMFLKLWLGFEKPIDIRWSYRTEPKWAQSWPAHLRFVMEDRDRWPSENRASLDTLMNVYDDHRFGPLYGLLFLLGTTRCVVGWRIRGLTLMLLPLVVISQLLIYAALDGALPRYREPLQPLITLVLAAGLTYLVASIARNPLRGSVAARQAEGHRPPIGASLASPHVSTSVRSDSAVRRS